MRKFFAIAIAVLMLSVLTPSASAETVTAGYQTAFGGGVAGVARPGLIACLGPPEQEVCETAGIDPIGGFDGARSGDDAVSNALATIEDDLFGNGATYFSICVYSDSHSICSEDAGDLAAEGCGSLLLTGHPGITSANPVAGFVFWVVVTEDLSDVCFGSSGSAVINYF